MRRNTWFQSSCMWSTLFIYWSLIEHSRSDWTKRERSIRPSWRTNWRNRIHNFNWQWWGVDACFSVGFTVGPTWPTWIVELKRICIIQMYIWIFNKYFIWKTKHRLVCLVCWRSCVDKTPKLDFCIYVLVAEAPQFYFRLNLIRQIYSFLTNK